ncbi:2Fe-2S iron-sulfur cluster-binding protein [Streptomyces griseoloalbus]|uniref:2Fe-2S iron-sulfur cluster-binding protein n=1 Tax=Streptomyces griseoloalbus TaxID=67303 RepID=A0ABV3EBF9_9ACTN
MTDDQHGEGTPPGGGRWDPLPQGEYDDGATAFVNLPEGGIDALLDSMESPLAAPGHGYVPPQITVTPTTTAGTDPAATGTWAAPGAPVDGAQWHDPHAAEADAATGDRFTYDPGATGQWAYEETGPEHPAPGHDVTGQWSIPVAGGDLPDESGEFTTSALVEQWGGTPPATLPGGAPAPWATQAIGQPWGPGVPGVPQEQDQQPGGGHGFARERQEAEPGPYGDPGRGEGPAYQQPSGPDAYGGQFAHYASAPGQPQGEHAPEPPGGAEHLPGPGPAPEPSGMPGHAPEQPADAMEARPHGGPLGEPAQGEGPAYQQPSGPDAYGGQPAPHASAPEQPPGEGDSEWSGGVGHAPGQPGAGVAPEASGMPGHAPEQPAHEGHRSSGVPQPFATDGYAEPRWPSDAEAVDGAAPGLREHPHPGGQDASVPVSGVGGASGASEVVEGAEGAPEADESPAGPSTAPGGTEPDAEAEAGDLAGDGVPAAGAESPGGEDGPNAATTHDTSGEPEASGESDTPDGPDGSDGSDGADGPDGSDGPDGPDSSDGSDVPDPSDDSAGPPALAPDAPPPGAPHDDHPLATYVLRVNGTDRPVTDAWIGESLLYVLRERLGLAGAKDGCSQGECGACNVQVDGRLVASCLVPAVTAAGSEVRTVEGLAQDGRPSDVQRALARCGAVQCGFCVPGMAMTVHDLLEGNPAPTELETRQALCGNLCRCSGYRGVVDAVKEVVAEREAHSESPEPDPDGEADTPRIPHQAGPGAGGVNPSAFGTPEPRNQPDGQIHDHPHDQSYGQDGGQA